MIERNRITAIVTVGATAGDMRPSGRPQNATKEIDATGMYVPPGLVDLHLHKATSPRHLRPSTSTSSGWPTASRRPWRPLRVPGVLGTRGKEYQERNHRSRMFTGPSTEWEGTIETPEKARSGACSGGDRDRRVEAQRVPTRDHGSSDRRSKAAWTRHDCALEPARCGLDERARRSTARARHGHAFLRTIRSLYDGHDVQPWPPGHNHADEQHRFGQVARQWNLIHKQGSPEWKALLTELKARNVILDPTMTAYLASRDVMARRNADWHETYTLPSLWDFYQPSRANHGSYYFDWTSWDEAAWRSFYRVWMTFLNDYKNMGGRVTVSSDAGYIYNTFGFSTIEEMELLQEAGFHPLEVIRGATLHAAQALFEPKKKPIEFGVVRAACSRIWSSCPRIRSPTSRCSTEPARGASTRRPARPSGSAASGTRSRTASSTTRGSSWPTWPAWWRSRRRSGGSRGCRTSRSRARALEQTEATY